MKRHGVGLRGCRMLETHLAGGKVRLAHLVQYSDGMKSLMFVCGAYVYASVTLARQARVLEIGGGPDPHPAADVIVEKYLDDNRHRAAGAAPMLGGNLMVADGKNEWRMAGAYRPTVVEADVCSMPMFADGEFDFAIAKDVLEHVPDVRAACAELSRVARGGFVDVPRVESEWLFPMPPGVHRWVFTRRGDTLVAHAKEFLSPFGGIMHRLFGENEDLRDAWAQSRHYFHLAFLWTGGLKCEVGPPAKMGNINFGGLAGATG